MSVADSKRRATRWWGLGLALLCALVIAVFEYLNFTDFCYAEARYLGDQGLIDAAIRYEIEHVPPRYFTEGARKYASVEEFREVNPTCCDMLKWGDPAVRVWGRHFAVWMRRIFGQYFIVVMLDYRVRDEGPQQFSGAHYLINSCGRLREGVSWWGKAR
jgi:hypothetical protein